MKEENMAAHLRFYKHLAEVMTKAGGHWTVFSDEELMKMARVFGQNNIRLVYEPPEK